MTRLVFEIAILTLLLAAVWITFKKISTAAAIMFLLGMIIGWLFAMIEGL